MPKADNKLYLYGEYMVLTDNSDESIRKAEKIMQDQAVQFLKDKGILQIITHRDEVKPEYFSEGRAMKLVASVGWKLNMNPLLKEPDINEQPVKPLTEFLNWLGLELRESVNNVFQHSRNYTMPELRTSIVDAINAVIDKKITMNQGGGLSDDR